MSEPLEELEFLVGPSCVDEVIEMALKIKPRLSEDDALAHATEIGLRGEARELFIQGALWAAGKR